MEHTERLLILVVILMFIATACYAISSISDLGVESAEKVQKIRVGL